jgi:hypothetical protein
LIELMIVVAIIAIIASIAIPNLLSARLAANESAAIATLRNVVSAQSQVQSQGAIDVDLDGLGEHGWFAEMAGTIAMRAAAAAVPVILNPPVMSGALGIVNAQGHVNKSGYLFAMYLPDINALPLAEAAGGGTPGGEGADFAENTWICYAWPAAVTNTGNRAFVVNQTGDVLQTNNQIQGYTGTAGAAAIVPAGAAALTGAALTSALSIGGNPAAANDGGTWLVVN